VDPARLKARDVMTKGIVYCRTDQSVEHPIHLMEDNKEIRRAPVINDKQRLVGIAVAQRRLSPRQPQTSC
jgi:CBS-domain-containing membrane protein